MKTMVGTPEALSAADAPPMRSYRMPARVLHWLTAVLVLAMIACGVIAKQLGEGPIADSLMGMHKLTGVLTLAIVVLRLLYRVFSSVPQWALQARRRSILHWTLYAIVITVPLLGWAGISDFGAREAAFGIVLPPIWPEGAGYDEILLRVHAYTAFALLALVAFHIGAAVADTMTAGQPGDSRNGD